MKLSEISVRELVLVLILGIVLVVAAYGYQYFHREAKLEPCIAASNEQCPPQELRQSWADFLKRRAAFNAEVKSKGLADEQHLLNGWFGEINSQTPPGYRFNEQTLKYERIVQPLPPQTEAPKK